MSVPLLLSQANGYHVIDTPTFNWTPVHDSATNGALVAYEFQLADDRDCTSIVKQFETDRSSNSTNIDPGTYFWRVRAVYGGPPRTTSQWSDPHRLIYGPNSPPFFITTGQDIVLMEDSVDAHVGNLTVSNTDGDWLVYEADGLEHIKVRITTDGHVYMTPEPNWTGVDEVTFIAREYLIDEPLSANLVVTVRVLNVNDPPTINGSLPDSIKEDEPFELDLLVSDPDPTGDVLEYEFVTDHAFLILDEGTGVLRGLPTNDDVGVGTVTINVHDGNGGGVSRGFLLEVVNVNDAPSITTEDVLRCDEDALYRVDYEAEDVDPTMDVLKWDMETDATFLTCDWATGMVEGKPAQKDVGTYSMLLTVSDGRGGSSSTSFDLEVVAVDDPPSVMGMEMFSVDEDDATMLDLEQWIDDVDTPLDQLVLASDHPAVVSIEGFEITLLYMDPVYMDLVEFEISDGTTRVVGWFSVLVRPVNDPPQLVMIGPFADPWDLVVKEGDDAVFNIIIADVDSPSVAISITSSWDHVSLDGATGDTRHQESPQPHQVHRWGCHHPRGGYRRCRPQLRTGAHHHMELGPGRRADDVRFRLQRGHRYREPGGW